MLKREDIANGKAINITTQAVIRHSQFVFILYTTLEHPVVITTGCVC